MNQFSTKVKLIFLPFLIIAASTICVYTFLNWLLLIKLQLFKIENEEIVNLLVPMALPWIPLLIWLRPRIKLLNFKTGGRGNPIGGILYLNWISIGVPLIIAQLYIVTATGKLTRLTYMSEINHFPPTKYYTVKHFYTNKRLVHIKAAFNVSGKSRTDFNMNIYAAVPVFDHVFPDTNMIAALRNSVNSKALVILNGKLSTMQLLKKLPADSIKLMRVINPTIVMPKYGDAGKYGALAVVTKGYNIKVGPPFNKITPVAWLAINYNKTIGNNLSLAEKQLRYKEFALQSQTDFNYRTINNFAYLDRVSNNRDLKNYKAAIESRGDIANNDEPIVLSPVYNSFDARNGNKLVWILASFGVGCGIFLIILNEVKLKPDVSIVKNECDTISNEHNI